MSKREVKPKNTAKTKKSLESVAQIVIRGTLKDPSKSKNKKHEDQE